MGKTGNKDAAGQQSMEAPYATDADTWLNWAEATYAGSQTLFLSDNALVWFPAAVLGHQALEMFLKAALIRHGHRISQSDVWGHDLGALAQRLIAHGVELKAELMRELQEFTDYFNELRYPARLNRVTELGREHGLILGALVESIRPYARAAKP
jgi:HEPN domain-containing protein